MSYILQALARSERERKQLESRDLGEALEITSTPAVSGPSHSWAMAITAGALVTLTLGLAILAMRPGTGIGTAPSSAAGSPSTSPPEARTDTSAPPSRSVDTATTRAPSAIIAPVAVRPSATSPLQQVAVSSVPKHIERPEPSSPNPIGHSPAQDEPTKTQEPDRVRSLPGIDVTIHVYSDQPERRFVYVNGKRYNEQETIAGMRARVASITRDGLIIDLGDRRVLLEVRE
jgi:general secretion pathway protein B